ncbi:prolipoprotein diacylglyceryl transferase [Clostridium polynesiense]|uniref:prolipoprotein diacylglyceryl transferase n=1 Tax=Clostridium polynesiense TaxID=1325933 RepID=UPI00058DF7CF|nr:prolipoprotein diacylglyceryl transferase [Clostridium polynesiense]
MDPIAFSIFGLEIRWYGILIASGIMVGMLIAQLNCRIKNISFDNFLDTFLVSLIPGVIGARLYYVAFEFENYKDNLMSIFNIREGGLAIHGALIFGIGTAYIYSKIKKINFWDMADIAAPSFAIAQAIGRWGNFMNGEAHGGAVSYEFISKFPEFIQKGMYIDGSYYHPTFLYESLWNLALFIILMIIIYNRQDHRRGIVIFSYIALYSLGRIFIEGMRTDSLMIMGFRAAQIVSLLGIIIGIIGIIIIKRRKKTWFY